jgi:hypothetical protein
MKGFPTEAALLQAAHLTTPTVVKTPTLVLYIQDQLEFLEMIEARPPPVGTKPSLAAFGTTLVQ